VVDEDVTTCHGRESNDPRPAVHAGCHGRGLPRMPGFPALRGSSPEYEWEALKLYCVHLLKFSDQYR
jgi:cytochrome c553